MAEKKRWKEGLQNMGKQIEIKVNGTIIKIDSDTPDFKELVNVVISNQNFDFKNINVDCEDEKFDKESFKDALISVIESTLKSLTIQYEKLGELLNKIKEEKEKFS